jgi:prepilin-type processing-associated H-X9-DG protein
LHQLALAMQLYQRDNNASFPSFTGAPPVNWGWADGVAPYLPSTACLKCPTDPAPAGTDPQRPGYVGYFYNRNLNEVATTALTIPARTVVLGEGSVKVSPSTSTYSDTNIQDDGVLPPDRRHDGGADYLFADGTAHWLEPGKISAGVEPPSSMNANCQPPATGYTFCYK